MVSRVPEPPSDGFEILTHVISKIATCQDDCQYREDQTGHRVPSAFMEPRRENVTAYRKVEAIKSTNPPVRPNDLPNLMRIGRVAEAVPKRRFANRGKPHHAKTYA